METNKDNTLIAGHSFYCQASKQSDAQHFTEEKTEASKALAQKKADLASSKTEFLGCFGPTGCLFGRSTTKTRMKI